MLKRSGAAATIYDSQSQKEGINWNNACAVLRETKCEHAGEINPPLIPPNSHPSYTL